MEQIRLTIVTELYMREMGIRQFHDSIGGSSYDSVRRHFFKLIEFGWLRYVRTIASGRGRPEKVYRATELPVIDTETWRTLPYSVRDAFTVQLLEEMGGRLGESLLCRPVSRPESIASFNSINVDQLGWCEGYAAVERCFHMLHRKQTDAMIRLENSDELPRLLIVNLAAFEAPRPGSSPLPKADAKMPPPPWPRRVGKVFMDSVDLAIVDELNANARTPVELQATFGGSRSRPYLRRCERLVHLGWAVCIDSKSGGPLHGAKVTLFRAAAPNVTESDIYAKVPRPVRKGRDWDTFRRFIATSIGAIGAGTFNNRTDRHLSMSPLLLDELGQDQVLTVINAFKADLRRLEKNVAKRRRKGRDGTVSAGFPAGYLVISFEAPLREGRR
jgi:hypothetical protein